MSPRRMDRGVCGVRTRDSSSGRSSTHLSARGQSAAPIIFSQYCISDVLPVDVRGVQQGLQLVVVHPAILRRVAVDELDPVDLPQPADALLRAVLAVLPALGDDAALCKD